MICYIGKTRQTASLTVFRQYIHESPARRPPIAFNLGLFLLHLRTIVPSVDRQLTDWRSHVVAFIYILIFLHFAGPLFVLRWLNCMYGCLFQPLALVSVSASLSASDSSSGYRSHPVSMALTLNGVGWVRCTGKALNWYLLCAGVAIRT